MTAPTPAPTRYRLADHVRACHVDGQVILLDLVTNKYIGVTGARLDLVSAAVVDWPQSEAVMPSYVAPADAEVLISSLYDRGLLVRADTAPPSRTLIELPLETLGESNTYDAYMPKWRSLVSLGCSTMTASRWLRHLSLVSIAARVERLRAPEAPADQQVNAEDLQRTVGWYLRMRPLVMTAHDKCLHDSLTLLQFLARRGHYPHWVIGVRTRPFAAHSWVQSGGLVLNDLHERVRGFAPILVV